MEIKGNTAFVTGGASGLGGATSQKIHAQGGNVVIFDLNEEKGEALAQELGEGRAVFVKGDVTSEEQVKHALAKAESEFGGLHFNINCAGIGAGGRVVGKEGPMSLEVFSKVIQVNLIGTFNCIRLSAEVMLKHEPDAGLERGVVVNTASVAAFEGQIGQAPYSASKGGVVGMTLPIAREMAQHGVRVNTIAPGLFDTPLLGALPDEIKAALGAQVPFPARLGQPSEYGDLAVHILLNSMINGETIRLDGAIRMTPK